MLPAAAMRPSRVEAQRLRGGDELCGGRGGRSVGKRNREFRRAGERLARLWAYRLLDDDRRIDGHRLRLSIGCHGERATSFAEAAALSLVGGVGSGAVIVAVLCGGMRMDC